MKCSSQRGRTVINLIFFTLFCDIFLPCPLPDSQWSNRRYPPPAVCARCPCRRRAQTPGRRRDECDAVRLMKTRHLPPLPSVHLWLSFAGSAPVSCAVNVPFLNLFTFYYSVHDRRTHTHTHTHTKGGMTIQEHGYCTDETIQWKEGKMRDNYTVLVRRHT